MPWRTGISPRPTGCAPSRSSWPTACARAADAAKAETALALYVETDRPAVKAMWSDLAQTVDAHDLAILDLQRRVVVARGAVSPEEHRRRIFALRETLEDEDEQIRFETRSRIMEAVHELVLGMTFSPDPLVVTVTTKAGVSVDVNWEEWGETRGMAWTKWMPEPKS